jgi:rubrerythrin
MVDALSRFARLTRYSLRTTRYENQGTGGFPMAKSIKGTETEKNLLAAFAGESQARNRYTYFASAAKKEGFEQIANLFIETAENEKEHAKVFFKYLEGGEAEITASYPTGIIGDTKANLEAAAAGEKMEWTTLYKNFAQTAKDEGFDEVARSFEQISKVEQFHEARYRKLIANVASGKVFKKEAPVKWHCINCGYVFEGKDAPPQCPACKHPQAYYEVLAENY